MDQPDNINMLSQFGGRLILPRAPHVTFFTQEIELPGINMSVAEQPTPFVVIPLSGKLEYEPLNITFKVDENLENWNEIVNWMTALGSPSDFTQFKSLKQSDMGSKTGLTSDIRVSILKSSMVANKSFVFYDAFPVSLNGFSINTTDPDVQYIQTTVTFRYLRYVME